MSLNRSLPFFVLFVIFITYLPCLKAGFVNWDDDVHILKNYTLIPTNGINFREIWTSTVNNTYIPLTVTAWAIEHQFFGFNPFIFHLDNLLLHLMVTALVIIFSSRMGLSALAAALTGIFFGIHPLHVESVAWLTERKDVLYGFFYMSALLVYLQYLDTRSKKYFGWTLLLGILSICAKPMAISLPLTLFILDWFYQRQGFKLILFEKILCGALLIPFAFVTYWGNHDAVIPSAGQGLLIWTGCFTFYLYKFIFPWPLILFYGNAFNALALTSLFAAGWVFRRQRLFIFAIAFYLVNIFFLLRFHPFLDLVSDRYMYIPSVGLCMFVAVSIEKAAYLLKDNRTALCIFKIVISGMIMIMAVVTWKQCEVWQTSRNLWSNQLKHGSNAGQWLAYCKLANVTSGVEARKLYQKAIDLKPDFAESYWGMRESYLSSGDQGNAQQYYQLAIRYDRKYLRRDIQQEKIRTH